MSLCISEGVNITTVAPGPLFTNYQKRTNLHDLANIYDHHFRQSLRCRGGYKSIDKATGGSNGGDELCKKLHRNDTQNVTRDDD